MFNRVIMLGNLTRDCELRYLPSGGAVCTTGLASNRRFKKRTEVKAKRYVLSILPSLDVQQKLQTST